MLSEILTFIFFILIGLEIREGLKKPKDAILPALAALGGMIFPAFIFLAINPGSYVWASAMPTDIALAIGVLALLGKRVQPQVRIFLLTLAIADDLFSLVVLGVFYGDDLHPEKALATLGAAVIVIPGTCILGIFAFPRMLGRGGSNPLTYLPQRLKQLSPLRNLLTRIE